MPDGLYDRDFFEWTREQAAALRAHTTRSNAPLDLENLAEEIEALGRSERHALLSLIGTVIEHLIKLQFSPALDPRRGWQETVDRARLDIEERLEASPSLRREVSEMIEKRTPSTARMVAKRLADYGELNAEVAARLRDIRFTEADVLGESA